MGAERTCIPRPASIIGAALRPEEIMRLAPLNIVYMPPDGRAAELIMRDSPLALPAPCELMPADECPPPPG